jgi:DNA-binding response OmpR family regulator
MTTLSVVRRMPSKAPPRDASRPPRVLVADDDAEMRRLVGDSLRKDGYDIVEETDGGRLLVRIAAIYTFEGTVDPVDLIVSDIRMPVCTGLDILKGLRDAHWLTPVILMTAFGDDDVRARATRLGAVLFDKPFQMADLRSKVRELLVPPATAINA